MMAKIAFASGKEPQWVAMLLDFGVSSSEADSMEKEAMVEINQSEI